MVEAIVSMVLEQLGSFVIEQTNNKVTLIVGAEEEVKKLTMTFTSIQAVLRDADRKQIQNESVKDWLENLKRVTYKIEDVIDMWNIKLLRKQTKPLTKNKVSSYFLAPGFCFTNSIIMRHNVGSEIKGIREELEFIASQKSNYVLIESGVGNEELKLTKQRQTSSLATSEVYGREEDKNIILRELLSENEREKVGVRVICIVAVGGLGKTALAQLVLKEVKGRFHTTAWVCVSEPFDKIKLAKAIINKFGGDVPGDDDWDTLHTSMFDIIKDKLFLLVLDDVWTEVSEDWEPFKQCLIRGAPGSRILVTSRKVIVANVMKSSYTCHLKGLDDKSSWSLFCNAASLDKEKKEYEMLKVVGKGITEKCNGVPLYLKTVGSVLSFKMNIEAWETVMGSDLWETLDEEKGVVPALLLSYYDLPAQLKPCLTYCAVFPKDYQIKKTQLINLWMSHGLLYSKTGREIEKIGGDYFDILVRRTLLQDIVTNNTGHVISCKMHDLVHDLVQFLTKHETHICLENNDLQSISRNSLHLTAWNMENSRSVIPTICKAKGLRTLNLHIQDCNQLEGSMFVHLTRLRSLDLSDNEIEELPEEVGKLIHLRYLDLSRTELKKLPESACNLCYLQTLILSGCRKLCELPISMGKMTSLWQLVLSKTGLTKLPESLCDLSNLQILNLKGCVGLSELPNNMGKMSSLRRLHLDRSYNLSDFPQEIGRLTSLQVLGLRKLDMSGVVGTCALQKLNDLDIKSNDLKVSGLGTVEPSRTKEAVLSNKRYIKELVLDFKLPDDLESTGEDDQARMEGVIEILQPHPNLEGLEVNYYKGAKLPSWMSSDFMLMWKLRELYIWCAPYLKELPAVWKLESLEMLKLHGLHFVKQIGPEFFGHLEKQDGEETPVNSSKNVVFRNLLELSIQSMNELEELVFPFERRNRLRVMPRLQSLELKNLPKLKKLPAIWKLESLKTLGLYNLHSVKQIGPEFFGLLEKREETSVTSSRNVVFLNLLELEMHWMYELEELEFPFDRSEMFRVMPRLQSLELMNLPKLKKLPGIWQLESLQELKIWDLKVKHIDLEFFGISVDDIRMSRSSSGESLPITIFPKLKKLLIDSLEELEKWEMMTPTWKEEDIIFIMPCFELLGIKYCEKIKVVPTNIFSKLLVEEKIKGSPLLEPVLKGNQIIRRFQDGSQTSRCSMSADGFQPQREPQEEISIED